MLNLLVLASGSERNAVNATLMGGGRGRGEGEYVLYGRGVIISVVSGKLCGYSFYAFIFAQEKFVSLTRRGKLKITTTNSV